MSDHSLLMGGAFVRAATPTQQAILIPHWIENQDVVKARIEAGGLEGAPSGIVDEKSTTPFPCRVFLRAAHYEDDAKAIEREGGIAFYLGQGKIRLLPGDDEHYPVAAEIKAEVLPARLPGLMADPRVIGLRPFRDPRYGEIIARELYRSGLEAAPA